MEDKRKFNYIESGVDAVYEETKREIQETLPKFPIPRPIENIAMQNIEIARGSNIPITIPASAKPVSQPQAQQPQASQPSQPTSVISQIANHPVVKAITNAIQNITKPSTSTSASSTSSTSSASTSTSSTSASSSTSSTSETSSASSTSSSSSGNAVATHPGISKQEGMIFNPAVSTWNPAGFNYLNGQIVDSNPPFAPTKIIHPKLQIETIRSGGSSVTVENVTATGVVYPQPPSSGK